MLDQPIIQIAEPDLQELIDEMHREGKSVDFKAELWRVEKASNPNQADRDNQTIEFLKDVSSFANTDGGHLIVGMKDKDGAASELCGIEMKAQDQWKNRLDDLMQKWIDPRINAEMRFIDLQNAKHALIIHVSPSSIGPHRVTYQEHGHFYSRNSHGAFRMDTGELRTSFNRSLAVADRIRTFRTDRIQLIEGLELPLPVAPEPLAIMHLIPQTAFTTSTEFSIEQLKQSAIDVRPPGLDGSPYSRPNLDGYILHGESMDEKGATCRRYVQLFRNGILEAVSAKISYVSPSSGQRFWSTQAEKYLLDALPSYLTYLSKLGLRPPIWLMVTLCRAKEVNFFHDFGNRHFDRNFVMLPETLVNDATVPAHTILRPLFDQIWNAVGFDKCHRLNENGDVLRLEADRMC